MTCQVEGSGARGPPPPPLNSYQKNCLEHFRCGSSASQSVSQCLIDGKCLVICIGVSTGLAQLLITFYLSAMSPLCVCKEHDMGIFLPKISCSNVAERENIEMQLLVSAQTPGSAKTRNLLMMFYMTWTAAGCKVELV